jgi:hypothetical protein
MEFVEGETLAVRVFVSSTSDVQKERHLADRVMRSIAAEFNLPVSGSCSNFRRLAEEDDDQTSDPENHGALLLCPFFWEYQRFRPEADYLVIGSGSNTTDQIFASTTRCRTASKAMKNKTDKIIRFILRPPPSVSKIEPFSRPH